MNQRERNEQNYCAPNYFRIKNDKKKNLINHDDSFELECKEQIIQNICFDKPNRNIISQTQKTFSQNDFLKDQFTLNNYKRLIQDLQYSNTILNKKNIILESELEFVRNKYNETINDLNDINNHITICKDNQDKIIIELVERNNYLENLIIKNNNKNNKIKIDNKNIKDEDDNKDISNFRYFLFKMKQIFNDAENDNNNEKIKENDYLNIITNNVIRMKEELNKCKKDLEKKNFEINILKCENQSLKVKNNQINFSNKLIPNNNDLKVSSAFYNISTNYTGTKTPIEKNNNRIKPPFLYKELSKLINENNITNFEYKDKYSNDITKMNILTNKYKSHSPTPLRNNITNILSKKKDLGNLSYQNCNTEKNDTNNNEILNNFSINKNDNKIKENNLNYSNSISSFKTLNNHENDKTNNLLIFPNQTLSNLCQNSKNCLQNLMNNVTQLEYSLKEPENNIYENYLININNI